MATAEAIEEYRSSLADLTSNSKPLINMLTMLAEDHEKDCATEIVHVIETHIQKAKHTEKLSVMYLIDSVIKNLPKSNYIPAFTANIVQIFCGVFEKVDEKTRQSMFKLRQTWSEIFPYRKLYMIDVRVNQMDPAWPITAPSKAPGSIHINPKFIKQPSVESSEDVAKEEDDESAMRQQLIAKQQELLKLQQERLELELAETRAKLEKQKQAVASKNRVISQTGLSSEISLLTDTLPPLKPPSPMKVKPHFSSLRDPRLSRDPRRATKDSRTTNVAPSAKPLPHEVIKIPDVAEFVSLRSKHLPRSPILETIMDVSMDVEPPQNVQKPVKSPRKEQDKTSLNKHKSENKNQSSSKRDRFDDKSKSSNKKSSPREKTSVSYSDKLKAEKDRPRIETSQADRRSRSTSADSTSSSKREDRRHDKRPEHSHRKRRSGESSDEEQRHGPVKRERLDVDMNIQKPVSSRSKSPERPRVDPRAKKESRSNSEERPRADLRIKIQSRSKSPEKPRADPRLKIQARSKSPERQKADPTIKIQSRSKSPERPRADPRLKIQARSKSPERQKADPTIKIQSRSKSPERPKADPRLKIRSGCQSQEKERTDPIASKESRPKSPEKVRSDPIANKESRPKSPEMLSADPPESRTKSPEGPRADPRLKIQSGKEIITVNENSSNNKERAKKTSLSDRVRDSSGNVDTKEKSDKKRSDKDKSKSSKSSNRSKENTNIEDTEDSSKDKRDSDKDSKKRTKTDKLEPYPKNSYKIPRKKEIEDMKLQPTIENEPMDVRVESLDDDISDLFGSEDQDYRQLPSTPSEKRFLEGPALKSPSARWAKFKAEHSHDFPFETCNDVDERIQPPSPSDVDMRHLGVPREILSPPIRDPVDRRHLGLPREILSPPIRDPVDMRHLGLPREILSPPIRDQDYPPMPLPPMPPPMPPPPLTPRFAKRPSGERRLSLTPDANIPKELALHSRGELLKRAEMLRHSGEISHHQHQEFLSDIGELDHLQRELHYHKERIPEDIDLRDVQQRRKEEYPGEVDVAMDIDLRRSYRDQPDDAGLRSQEHNPDFNKREKRPLQRRRSPPLLSRRDARFEKEQEGMPPFDRREKRPHRRRSLEENRGRENILMLPHEDPRWAMDPGMLGFDDQQEVVIDKHLFAVTVGGPARRIHLQGFQFEMHADEIARAILINGELVYTFGEPVKDVKIDNIPHKFFYHGPSRLFWLNGQPFDIRIDAPPKKMLFGDKHKTMQIDGRDMMLLVDRIEKGPYGGPPRDLIIEGQRFEIRFEPPPRNILVDGEECELCLHQRIPFIMIQRKPHLIAFDGPPRNVHIDDNNYLVPCDSPVRIRLGNRSHVLALGGPAHEVIIDGKWFEVKFGGPPRQIQLGNRTHILILEGSPPDVKILHEVPFDYKPPKMTDKMRKHSPRISIPQAIVTPAPKLAPFEGEGRVLIPTDPHMPSSQLMRPNIIDDIMRGPGPFPSPMNGPLAPGGPMPGLRLINGPQPMLIPGHMGDPRLIISPGQAGGPIPRPPQMGGPAQMSGPQSIGPQQMGGPIRMNGPMQMGGQQPIGGAMQMVDRQQMGGPMQIGGPMPMGGQQLMGPMQMGGQQQIRAPMQMGGQMQMQMGGPMQMGGQQQMGGQLQMGGHGLNNMSMQMGAPQNMNGPQMGPMMGGPQQLSGPMMGGPMQLGGNLQGGQMTGSLPLPVNAAQIAISPSILANVSQSLNMLSQMSLPPVSQASAGLSGQMLPPVSQAPTGLSLMSPFNPQTSQPGLQQTSHPSIPQVSNSAFPGIFKSTTSISQTNTTTTPSFDVDFLFKKLMGAGIINKVENKEKAKEKAKPEEEEENPEIEEEELIEDVPDLTRLKPKALKRYYHGVIQRLYCGIQCSSCGMRFVLEDTERYREHLDWHFRQNKREKEGIRVAKNRRWFYSVNEWITYEEIEESEERTRSSIFERVQESTEDEVLFNLPAGEEIMRCPPASGNEKDACEICGEPFEQYFDEEEEEWHLRDAVRAGDKTYHPVCFEDATQGSLGTSPSCSPTTSPVTNPLLSVPVDSSAVTSQLVPLTQTSTDTPSTETSEVKMDTDSKPINATETTDKMETESVTTATESKQMDTTDSIISTEIKSESEETDSGNTNSKIVGNTLSSEETKTAETIVKVELQVCDKEEKMES